MTTENQKLPPGTRPGDAIHVDSDAPRAGLWGALQGEELRSGGRASPVSHSGFTLSLCRPVFLCKIRDQRSYFPLKV